MFDIETIARASFDLNKNDCQHQEELASHLDEENKVTMSPTRSLKFQLVASRSSALESIDESLEAKEENSEKQNATLELNVANCSGEITQNNNVDDSNTFKRKPLLDDFQKSFEALEAHFVESVRSHESVQEAEDAEDSLEFDNEFIVSIITDILNSSEVSMESQKRHQDSSPQSLTECEIEISSTKIDDNNGKVFDISTSTESSKQLQVACLIDDVCSSSELLHVPTRATDANPVLMEVISLDNAKATNNDDKVKEKSQKSHETTWQSSNSSSYELHKASTFTSDKDIFVKQMEVLRKRLDDGLETEIKLQASGLSCDSECIFNEVVKQVFNFDNE